MKIPFYAALNSTDGKETKPALCWLILRIYLEDKHDLFQILSQENRNTILQYWHDERER